MSKEQFQAELEKIYETTTRDTVSKTICGISMKAICNQYERYPNWAVGPISRRDAMTFRKRVQWDDPAKIGWKSGFIFNPSLIKKDGKLLMFYRAAPMKESLCSRIGLAIYDPESGCWTDYEKNPLIYPTDEDEILSVEDPKVYSLDDGYVMFYNGICPVPLEKKEQIARYNSPSISVVSNMKAAVSKDLYHWEKIGLVVPLSVSKYWAKAAVIPRNPDGMPVRINGRYIMYISEGCGNQQTVGYSEDMIHWRFEPQNYLNIGDMGKIREVACSITQYGGKDKWLLLDFFYQKPDGTNSAAQALYSIDEPFKQLEINKGGTLSWGGLIEYDSCWHFAQGWDAPEGNEEIYIYTAPLNKLKYFDPSLHTCNSR